MHELTEEVSRGEPSGILRFMTQLIRSFPAAQPMPGWLSLFRAEALMHARLFDEAARVLEPIYEPDLSEQGQAILELRKAQCALNAKDYQAVVQRCATLVTRARSTVLANAYLIQYQALKALGRTPEAIEAARLGSQVDDLKDVTTATIGPDGGRSQGKCATSYCRELLGQQRFETCVTEARRLKASVVFPSSAEVCLVGALALMLMEAPEEQIRELLAAGCWAQGADDTNLLIMMRSMHRQLTDEVANQALRDAADWVVGAGDLTPPTEVRIDREGYCRYWAEAIAERPRQILEFSLAAGAEHAETRAHYLTNALNDAAACESLGQRLEDVGKRHLAKVFYEKGIEVLSDHLLAGEVTTHALLAELAYCLARMHRISGGTATAIQWAIVSLEEGQAAGSMPGCGDDITSRMALITSLATQMLGNCQFDQRDFAESYRFHLKALTIKVGLGAEEYNLADVLARLDAIESPGVGLLNSVVNVGNSLHGLDDHEQFVRARLAALWVALRIQDATDDDPAVLQHNLQLLEHFTEGLTDPSLLDFAHASLANVRALLSGQPGKDRLGHYENR